MKSLLTGLILFCSLVSFGQGKDKQLIGEWTLFEVIDNLTGLVVPITHKSDSVDFEYNLEFTDSLMKFNLEINKCESEYIVSKDRQISFRYFSDCTEFCCDGEFSKLLTYDEATKYFIKEDRTLILVSEDRIFYFKKKA